MRLPITQWQLCSHRWRRTSWLARPLQHRKKNRGFELALGYRPIECVRLCSKPKRAHRSLCQIYYSLSKVLRVSGTCPRANKIVSGTWGRAPSNRDKCEPVTQLVTLSGELPCKPRANMPQDAPASGCQNGQCAGRAFKHLPRVTTPCRSARRFEPRCPRQSFLFHFERRASAAFFAPASGILRA